MTNNTSNVDALRQYLGLRDWLYYEIYHVDDSDGRMLFSAYRIDRIKGDVQRYTNDEWVWWWLGDATVFAWMREHLDQLYER